MLVLSVPGGSAGSRADLLCSNTTPVAAQITEAEPGPTGPTGPTGATGPTGPTGPTGATGPTNVGVTQSQIGWLPAGGSSNVLTMLGAGHAAGTYLLAYNVVVRTAGASGNVVPGFSYSVPTFGISGAVGASIPVTPTGARNTLPSVIQSNGVSAILIQFSPASVVGAPVMDLYACAVPVGV